jgi:hypothetical protein
MSTAEVKKTKCIATGCKSTQFARGLCCACYFIARRAIDGGQITEAELIKRNLIKPAKRGKQSQSAIAKLIRK